MKKLSSREQVELVFCCLVNLHGKSWMSLDPVFFGGLIQNIIISKYGYDDYDDIGKSEFEYIRNSFNLANQCIEKFYPDWIDKKDLLIQKTKKMLLSIGMDGFGNSLN